MKLKASTSRKLRYGGVTAVLTALIIAVVIVVNVIFSALSQKFLWYADLTPELLFTLSDNCIDLMNNGDSTFENSSSPIKRLDEDRAAKRAEDPNFKDEDLMIRIIFCDDPDAWESNSTQRYVYETAKQLRDEFPEYITIENVNVIWNPSRVTKYTTTSNVSTTSVVVEYGSEYRVRTLRSFYTFNDTSDEEPWAYNGEKIMAASILAVTRTDVPVACITTNHGEQWVAGQSDQLIATLDTAGFKVQQLNLATEEIPAKCRLIVVFDPRNDFMIADGVSEIDEIAKLDAFLDGTNSMMVFMSPEVTTPLTNFEEYLEEWGIVYDRQHTGSVYNPYIVQDTTQSLTVDGFTVKANYYEQGLGGQMTEDLRKRSVVPPTMVFEQAMSISFATQNNGLGSFSPTHYTDEEDATISYDYASAYVDGYSRSIYDVFVTSDGAVAHAGGAVVESASKGNNLKLMTVSVEDRTTQESNYTTLNEASYVIACGSPQFAYNDVLTNNSYGNAGFLEYALRIIGQEPVPVGLTFKPFGDYTMDTVTTAEATQYTVVLTVVPAILSLGVGIFVIVRRKNR